MEYRRKREDQGLHECEVWGCEGDQTIGDLDMTGLEGGGEWESCEKNPGHKHFIPVPDFDLCHLPSAVRTPEVLSMVRAQADLTVRLRVRHTSRHRPDGYPFSNSRGKNIHHTGSGVVFMVCAKEWDSFPPTEEEETQGNREHTDDGGDDDDVDKGDDGCDVRGSAETAGDTTADGSCSEEARDEVYTGRSGEHSFERYKRGLLNPEFDRNTCPCHECEDDRYDGNLAQMEAEADTLNTLAVGASSPGSQLTDETVNTTAVYNSACDITQKEVPKQTTTETGNTISGTEQKLEATNMQTPRRKPYWIVFIRTAMHVVYDSDEVEKTVVDVFHDRNKAVPSSQRLYGYVLSSTEPKGDVCIFQCITHNEKLVKRLCDSQSEMYNLAKGLEVKFSALLKEVFVRPARLSRAADAGGSKFAFPPSAKDMFKLLASVFEDQIMKKSASLRESTTVSGAMSLNINPTDKDATSPRTIPHEALSGDPTIPTDTTDTPSSSKTTDDATAISKGAYDTLFVSKNVGEILAISDGATDIAATSKDATGIPSTSKDVTGIPSTSKDATGIPSTSKDATGIPSTSKDATGIPSTSKDATGIPSTSKDATDIPSTSKDATDIPSTSKDATAILCTSRNNTDPPQNVPFGSNDPEPSHVDSSDAVAQSRVAIIIGHPHGRGKTITVGHWKERVKAGEKSPYTMSTYVYDTPTCKGNSGGSVMTFAGFKDERLRSLLYRHHHRAACTTPGLNMSSPALES